MNKDILTKLRQKKDVSKGKKQGEVTWGDLADDVARCCPDRRGAPAL